MKLANPELRTLNQIVDSRANPCGVLLRPRAYSIPPDEQHKGSSDMPDGNECAALTLSGIKARVFAFARTSKCSADFLLWAILKRVARRLSSCSRLQRAGRHILD